MSNERFVGRNREGDVEEGSAAYVGSRTIMERIVIGFFRFLLGVVATIVIGALEGVVTGMIGALIADGGRSRHLLDGAVWGAWMASLVAAGVGVVGFIPVSIVCARLDDDRAFFR